MNIAKIKEAIDALVALLKDMIKDMTWFINGWKSKDALDEEVTEEVSE